MALRQSIRFTSAPPTSGRVGAAAPPARASSAPASSPSPSLARRPPAGAGRPSPAACWRRKRAGSPRSSDLGRILRSKWGPVRVLGSILEAVGHTPLVRLSRITAGLRPTILAKVETLNPGGSVKDRIGLRMIEDAERSGQLKPGGTIVEPTSGNTGHALAIAAAIRGYRTIFVMADKQSPAKIALPRAYGAEVVDCPSAVPRDSPESYYSVAERLSREIPGAFQPNQYFNQANPRSHYETTGPEIWEQTDGKVDVVVGGLGTGGAMTGIARPLKGTKKSRLAVSAEPE